MSSRLEGWTVRESSDRWSVFTVLMKGKHQYVVNGFGFGMISQPYGG